MKTSDNIIRQSGITLVEIIVVISLLAILALIAIPIFRGFFDKLETTFNYFVQEYEVEICPKGGIITYNNGVVNCSIYKSDESNGNDEEVPYL